MRRSVRLPLETDALGTAAIPK